MFCLMVFYSSDLKVELDLEELQPRVGLGGQARYNKKSFSTASVSFLSSTAVSDSDILYPDTLCVCAVCFLV